jgi:ferritin-like metal-binding protein YciE
VAGVNPDAAAEEESMASVDSLQTLMIEELKDLYDAEKQITKALPKMAKAASSDKLRAAFEEHLEQTHGQIERLEEAFSHLGLAARGKKCEGIKGLIEEGKDHMKEIEEDSTLDAALIGAAQKVEHYEMAAYGTARTFAMRLGYDEVAALLEQTLEEEKTADRLLSELAESVVNPRAHRATHELEDEGEMPGRSGRRTASRGLAMAGSGSPDLARSGRSRGNGPAGRGRSGGRG